MRWASVNINQILPQLDLCTRPSKDLVKAANLFQIETLSSLSWWGGFLFYD
jgi:hypothetical protein